MLTIDAASTFSNNGTISANGGTLVVDDDISGTGSATISGGGTLELGGADSQTVTFNGAGTLQLDAGSHFTGTVDGFVAGDVIDLANTVATTVVFDGSTLVVNGVQTSFNVSGVPAGDTFAFKSDGNGGTDLVVLPQVLSVESSSAGGTEGTAVHLNFSDTVTGATLTSFLISGIPLGATLSDGTHSFTASTGSTSIRRPWLGPVELDGDPDQQCKFHVVGDGHRRRQQRRLLHRADERGGDGYAGSTDGCAGGGERCRRYRNRARSRNHRQRPDRRQQQPGIAGR